jgi:purine-binding chemotaxis protein CheW
VPVETAEPVLTFRVADTRYAIPASAVREVLRRPSVTPVPRAPASLVGLGNVRGTALPLVSLAALTGQPAGTAARVIVLDRADPIGILVDEVSAVVAAGSVPAQPLDLPALLDGVFGRASARSRDTSVASIAAPPAPDASAQLALLTLRVAGQEFALPLHEIAAVTRLPADIAPPTGTRTAIDRGGRTPPLLWLRVLLGLQHAPAAQSPHVVGVRIGGREIGLVVDAVGAVLRVDARIVDPLPAVLSRDPGNARIRAVCRLDRGRRLVSILATDRLLEDLSVGIAAHGDAIATPAATPAVESDLFLTFRLGPDGFALPVDAVAEVRMPRDTLTRLPRTPDFVAGAINLRGQVIPVVDQRRRALGSAATGRQRRVVVVALGDRRAGFIVDRVGDIRRVSRDAVRPAPELGEGTRTFGAAGAELVRILDPGTLLNGVERDLRAARGAGAPAA